MAQKLIHFLTIEEVQKLLKAEKRREYKLAIALGFGSGLRISEIVGSKRKDGTFIPPLSLENVNLEEHQIRVVQGKGKKDRITITSRWLNDTNIKILPLKIPTRTLQYNFTQLCKRVLGKPVNFHRLRHGFGNYWANEKKAPLPYIKSLMGHSRIDTTGRYTEANPKQAIKDMWETI